MDLLTDIRRQIENDTRDNRTNRNYVINMNAAKMFLKQPDIWELINVRLKDKPDILKAFYTICGRRGRKPVVQSKYSTAIEYIKNNGLVNGSLLYQQYGFGVMDMSRLIKYAEKRRGIQINRDGDTYFVQPSA